MDETSNIMKMENLEKEFDNTMTLYKQAYLDYIDSLKGINDGTKTIPNSMINFEGNVNVEYVATLHECSAICSGNPNCSGLSFNKVDNYCYLTTNRPVTYNSYGSNYPVTTVIMPVSSGERASNLASLNQKLMDLNKQIMSVTITPEGDYIENQKTTQTALLTIYKDLENERKKIAELSRDYNHTDNEYKDNSIYVAQKSSMNTLWLFITVFVLMTTVKVVIFNK